MKEENNPYEYLMPDQTEQSPIVPTYASDEDKANIMSHIKPEVIVETIRNRLRGMEQINGAWVQVPELKRRAITDEGAWEISTLLLSVSSRNVSYSKLSNDEIKTRTKRITFQAQKMCLDNWERYGIIDEDQLGFVNEIVISITLITLKQSESGGIRQMVQNMLHQNVVANDGNSERDYFSKRGLFRR